MYLALFWYFPNPPNSKILTGCLTCVCDMSAFAGVLHTDWNGAGKSKLFHSAAAVMTVMQYHETHSGVVRCKQSTWCYHWNRHGRAQTVCKYNNSIASLGQLWFAAWSVTHSVKLRLWHSAMPFSKRSRCKRRAWVPRRECQQSKPAWTTSSPCRRHCFSTGYSRKFVAEHFTKCHFGSQW